MFDELEVQLSGKLYWKDTTEHRSVRSAYATDASVYSEYPRAVAIPAHVDDVRTLVRWAREHKQSLIPRAAGTSLAGQVVGSGIVVDVSRYFNQILEINTEDGWVMVEPGVIRDDLNHQLKPTGLFFGPETSTASRAMIGGMIGNNSCGLHSLRWGTTRDQLLGVEAVLSTGELVWIDEEGIHGSSVGWVQDVFQLVHENAELIAERSPKSTVTRRNTGYALDALLDNRQSSIVPLIAGSEGTLVFITKAKLRLRPLPPPFVAVVAVHCHSLRESLELNLLALAHGCEASELVDDVILEYAKQHPTQRTNSQFLVGEPKAILMVEFFGADEESIQTSCRGFIESCRNAGKGFAFPILQGEETKQAWELRKAGLGLIRNIPGDIQPVNLIEDCAVAVEDLPDYMDDLTDILTRHGVTFSVYAHAGAGELHVEPLLNLKDEKGRKLFREILAETSELIKKYRGSLSGEHGDGRLRGEFIPVVMGHEMLALFRQVKHIFDPDGLFNPGKIVDTPPMDAFLRVDEQPTLPLPSTTFGYGEQENILRLAEKCSGSGDCRKTELTGGTMCPSFMATREEQHSTRARANALRSYFTRPTGERKEEVKQTLDLCLSCKACQTECPSSVDITQMKADFLQHVYDREGIPLRSRLVGYFPLLMNWSQPFAILFNYLFETPWIRRTIHPLIGFHPDRSMPRLGKTTVLGWWKKRGAQTKNTEAKPLVYLFLDEFTNFQDVSLGIKTIQLIEKLGYRVDILNHVESGRTYLSKGLVRQAKQKAEKNVEVLAPFISEETPLIGIEPSAILTFRDEYPKLVSAPYQAKARHIAEHTFLFEEWFNREATRGNIEKTQFTLEERLVKLHVHCHQKAISGPLEAKKALSFVKNYRVQLIPSGCCGMAGSFGYEKEHFEISQQIGELVLFPTIRTQPLSTLIAATGTSCRHQIWDGIQRESYHPIEILHDACI